VATAALSSTHAHSKRRRSSDTLILAAVSGLILVGLLVTYTASYSMGDAVYGDGSYFLKRQMIWTTLGVIAMLTMYSIDYRVWQRYSIPIIIGTLVMLTALLLMGAEKFGGQRWLVGGGSVQPSELAKMAVIIYIADWLAGKREDIKDVTLGLVPFAILMGVVCGLIMLQPDFSTALLIGLVATIMFFTAGADLLQMLTSGAMASVVLVTVIMRAPYRMERVKVFLDPESDPVGAGFQPLQTLHSIMAGGLTGVGLGQGQQKHILPTPHTDAVFAVLGEEMGMLGCLVVIALFAIIAWRGLRVAAGAPDRFGSLLATGITCWITFQALLNVAVVTAVVPFTGIPLPFLSFGGSSLIMCMAAVGLLLSLSTHADPKRARLHANLDLRRRDGRSRLSRAHRARQLRR
jgi:cell division protein FtsW